jgi:hypothetical protein
MAVAECKQAHVIVGATSLPTASVTLQITESKADTELEVGEVFDVTTGDLNAFWRTTAQQPGRQGQRGAVGFVPMRPEEVGVLS